MANRLRRTGTPAVRAAELNCALLTANPIPTGLSGRVEEGCEERTIGGGIPNLIVRVVCVRRAEIIISHVHLTEPLHPLIGIHPSAGRVERNSPQTLR